MSFNVDLQLLDRGVLEVRIFPAVPHFNVIGSWCRQLLAEEGRTVEGAAGASGPATLAVPQGICCEEGERIEVAYSCVTEIVFPHGSWNVELRGRVVDVRARADEAVCLSLGVRRSERPNVLTWSCAVSNADTVNVIGFDTRADERHRLTELVALHSPTHFTVLNTLGAVQRPLAKGATDGCVRPPACSWR